MDLSAASCPPPVVCVLFDNYGPYHFARLRGAQAVLASRARMIGLQMFATSAEYLWQPEPQDYEGLELQTILSPRVPGRASVLKRAAGIWRHLERLRPDSIAISGYAAPGMVTAMLWCRLRGRAAILISESKEDDTVRGWVKEAIKSQFVRRYHAAVVGGRPQRHYLEKLGFPPEGIFSGANIVGNDDYSPQRGASSPRPLAQRYFLMINRFVPKKNLPFALNSYAEYRRQLAADSVEPWDLVLSGEGEMRPELESLATALGIRESVHFPGFLQRSELVPYLAHCEAFLHASTVEQWGLVVNEAMAAGRPVIVSRRCGCFEDLIIEGKTGLGFDPADSEEFTGLMLQATRGELPLAELGTAALAHIETYSPTRFGEALRSALAYAKGYARGGRRYPERFFP